MSEPLSPKHACHRPDDHQGHATVANEADATDLHVGGRASQQAIRHSEPATIVPVRMARSNARRAKTIAVHTPLDTPVQRIVQRAL
jgi:hypothetical protein